MSHTKPPAKGAGRVLSGRPAVGRIVAGWTVAAVLFAGCGDQLSRDSGGTATDPIAGSGVGSDVSAPSQDVPAGTGRCLVRLHGKGGSGGPAVVSNGIVELSPNGNADGWGGRQWLYFPDDRYVEAVGVVAEAIDAGGCSVVAIDGFSNGAAFAAKLYCRGEDFGGRLRGVVIDDPVPDLGTTPCAPAVDVKAALYWTGALDADATAGADCNKIDWTCDGGKLIGIDAYAASLGLTVQPSPNSEHKSYLDPPELTQWLEA